MRRAPVVGFILVLGGAVIVSQQIARAPIAASLGWRRPKLAARSSNGCSACRSRSGHASRSSKVSASSDSRQERRASFAGRISSTSQCSLVENRLRISTRLGHLHPNSSRPARYADESNPGRAGGHRSASCPCSRRQSADR